ncbi:expressed unknown protein [Seminavis robusta]|uniref:Uncharacterized protein n=1 Tax=Seminavis robusta TaxID=568900 RepID=A0A9N8DKS8_9STRA|nr:expressed unknown protein [Seminavis robusta]|eukprot:Sro183_g079701.1  (507) ;mRNA; r:62838-64445
MLWLFNVLLCVIASVLLVSADGTGASEPQQYALTMIDLNEENRRLVPISGYVTYGGNLVGESGARFGYSVAIDETGTTIVVRERRPDIVRVYEIADDGWTQKGQDLTGFTLILSVVKRKTVTISSDGSIVAVSSTDPSNEGVALFEYDTSTQMWLQRGSTIRGEDLNGSPIFSFGHDISLSADGNKIAVGAPEYDSPTLRDIGFATTYFWNGIDWQRQRYTDDTFSVVSGLYGELLRAYLGWSTSFSGDGNWFAVGMPESGSAISDATRFGECRVYRSNAGIQQIAIDGGAMFGSSVNDQFGYSVALNYDGSIIAVSSPGYDGDVNEENLGRVQVFERSAETWRQLGSDLIGEQQDDGFGFSIDLSNDGKTLVAGSAYSDGSGNLRGYIHIYKFDGIDWVLKEISRAQGFDIDGIGENDSFGWSVAISGDGTKVLVGAPFYNGPDIQNGLVQMWGQTDFPTFSPILNPLPQVGNLGTGGSPAQASLVSRTYTWWQGAIAYLEGFFV